MIYTRILSANNFMPHILRSKSLGVDIMNIASLEDIIVYLHNCVIVPMSDGILRVKNNDA